MRKGFLMVLAVALVAVLAAPAVAGTDINGFYRAKGYVTNFDTPSAPAILNDMQTSGYVEQRFRMRFSFGEENVKAIAFFEIDFGSWGDSAGGAAPGAAARNVGGALGGDKVNLETKNIYLWFKVPNTSLDLAVGLQSQTDSFYGLLYGGADMAGIFATGKYEPVNWKLGWARLYENDVQEWDDVTLYMGAVNFLPSKASKLGLSAYYITDDSQKAVSGAASLPFAAVAGDTNQKAIATVGLDGAYNGSWGGLSGFLLYQWGKVEATGGNTDPDIDITAFAADLRGDFNLGPGKLFLEGLYVSGNDRGSTGTGDYEAVVTLADLNASPGGNSFFVRMDYQILMGNADDINQNTCLIGCAGAVGNNQSPGNNGRGMWTIGGGYSMKVAERTTFKFGAGYLQAVKRLATEANQKKNMGTEFNANVNYNIMKGLDFGLYGAYAMIGDFYNGTVTSGSLANNDPDDVWSMFLRLNYAF